MKLSIMLLTLFCCAISSYVALTQPYTVNSFITPIPKYSLITSLPKENSRSFPVTVLAEDSRTINAINMPPPSPNPFTTSLQQSSSSVYNYGLSDEQTNFMLRFSYWLFNVGIVLVCVEEAGRLVLFIVSLFSPPQVFYDARKYFLTLE